MQVFSKEAEIPNVIKPGQLAATFGLLAATSAYAGDCSDYATNAVAANKKKLL